MKVESVLFVCLFVLILLDILRFFCYTKDIRYMSTVKFCSVYWVY